MWFRGKEAGFVHLDRDDRGLLNDTIEIEGKVQTLNQEVVTIRAEKLANILQMYTIMPQKQMNQLMLTLKLKKLTHNQR